MKFTMVRNGVIVRSKLNNKLYQVTEMANNAAVACELIDDGVNENNKVTITETNALAFRFIDDPLPYPMADGYYVNDGILMKDGNAVCEQGDIVLGSIVAREPDYLILTTKENEDSPHVDLLSYRVSRDSFKRIVDNIPLPEYVGTVCGRDVVAYSNVVVSRDEVDGKDIVVRTPDDAGIIILENGRVVKHEKFEVPIVTGRVQFATANDTNFEVFAPMIEHWNTDEQKLEKNDSVIYRTIFNTREFTLHDDAPMFFYSFVEASWIARTENELLLIDRDMRITSPEIKKLNGYNYLIDVTKGEYQYTLTFSNDNYEFKTLVSKSTKDRGYIVTVE